MTYFRSLLINFLTVFFVNHVIPEVEIDYYSKLPNIGGDLIFSFALGFVNSMIYPVIVLLKVRPSHFKVGLSAFFITFGAYSIVNLLPVGIKLTSAGAFIWCSLITWGMAYITNHIELTKYLRKKEDEEEKEEKRHKEKQEPKHEHEESEEE